MSIIRHSLLVAGLALLCGLGSLGAQAADPGLAEIAALKAKVRSFVPATLPATGEVVLRPEQGVSIDDLREVELDDKPPVLGKRLAPYPPEMADDCPEGERPLYQPEAIRPFRFRYFHNEFNVFGGHTWSLFDYAALHGFDILVRGVPEEVRSHMPADTHWLHMFYGPGWDEWMAVHQIPEGRYDLLPPLETLVDMLVESGKYDKDPLCDHLTFDMEHGWLRPDNLRKQDWYPKNATAEEQAAFEQRYIRGFANTLIAPCLAARRQGWKNLGIYGFYPYPRQWGGLDKAQADPAGDWDWNTWGKDVYNAVDIIYASVYSFYWSPGNVAYVLANADLQKQMVDSMPVKKPIRFYFMPTLHGGGGGWRWWQGQPIAREEFQASLSLGLFTGVDGADIWSGGRSEFCSPPIPKANADLMIADDFVADSEAGEAMAFKRYDVVHALSVDPEKKTVRFQKIAPGKPNQGVNDQAPFYTTDADELRSHLIPFAESFLGIFEGLALAKPFEYLLRHGEVKQDIPSTVQFGKGLPVVRRVKLGKISVIGTYDPNVIFGGQPRNVTLPDFDGHAGLTLVLPAEAKTRIFVVMEP